MANPLLRSNLPDLFLEDALPSIDYIIQEEYEGFKPKFEQLFNVRNMKTSISQTTQVSSLVPASIVGEAESLPMQKIYQGYSKTYTARKFGILLATSQEAIDDEQYDVFNKNPRRLARSFMSAQEIDASSILNEAFSTVGPDGQSLCSVAHPLLAPGSASPGTNRLAVDSDLSMTSLKDMATLFRGQVDSAGNKISIDPKCLVVPKELEFTAIELLESVMLVDIANANVNALNSIKASRSMSPVVWDYLSDPDAWFLMADPIDHDINWYWRKQPSLDNEMEFKTEVALTKMSARWAVGFSDWRGITGTPGAP